jgi:hypothetical protein
LADRSSSFLPRRKSLFFLVSLLLMVEWFICFYW